MFTLKDVAKKSGFSVATVSAVVNGVPIVSKKAREQILKAISELGYRPNTIARSLKNAKTSSISIIARDITNPFYPEVISGLEDIAWANNYEVFLCNTEGNKERERKYIDNLIGKRVDGIIISTSLTERESMYDKLVAHNIPYVFLNRRPDIMLDEEYYIGSDNRLASEKIVKYLKKLDYSQIAFFGGPNQYSTFSERYSGFIDAMQSEGMSINDQWIIISDYAEKNGYDNAKILIHNKILPEVIFCASDLLAFGAYQALKEEGFRIPEDIALISIDNNRFGHLIDLTSVDMQNVEMGRQAAKVLLNVLSNKNQFQSKREILLEPQIVIRKSCGHT